MIKCHLSNRAIYAIIMAEHGAGVTSSVGTYHSNTVKEVRELAEEAKDLIGIYV